MSTRANNWHKTSGRIYRLGNASFKPTGQTPWVPTDLTTLSDNDLIELFAHPNKFWRQTAVRVLGERLVCAASQAGGRLPETLTRKRRRRFRG
ncbi:MAG: hypothetical protein R3B91_21575 [Planctomycetaceae bacterium]